mmetsp:Transcript_77188/g.243869  ORF Transcript_77188/g.243869 Transcript_77188/m.243869 type:complete len:251 (-) Transcript_77188:636-1388(-)
MPPPSLPWASVQDSLSYPPLCGRRTAAQARTSAPRVAAQARGGPVGTPSRPAPGLYRPSASVTPLRILTFCFRPFEITSTTFSCCQASTQYFASSSSMPASFATSLIDAHSLSLVSATTASKTKSSGFPSLSSPSELSSSVSSPSTLASLFSSSCSSSLISSFLFMPMPESSMEMVEFALSYQSSSSSRPVRSFSLGFSTGSSAEEPLNSECLLARSFSRRSSKSSDPSPDLQMTFVPRFTSPCSSSVPS